MKQIITRQAKRWLAGVGRRLGRSPNESGQSIIILTFAFIGMLAMLGIALDLGMVYIERIRLKRTVDAAALAAVSELPNEEAATLRALDYLRQNGYNVDQSHVYVAGCIQDVKDRVNPSGTTDLVNFPRTSMFDFATLPVTATLPISPALFYYYNDTTTESAPSWYIDTHSFSWDDPTACQETVSVKTATNFGGAPRIRVYGEVPVSMSFMQFFGFPAVTVSDQAVAQNSSSLDVAVVFDVTSSMELDTICYDCWRRCDQLPSGMSCGTDFNKFSDYPKNGKALSYDFNAERMAVLRTGDAAPQRLNTPGAPGDGKKPYIIIEGEFYTNNTSIWDPAARTAGVGYWALQRRLGGEGYSIDGYGYLGTTDNRSGFVRHHPYVDAEGNMGTLPFGRHYTLDDARGITAFKAPRLDYYFWPQWESAGATTYIYLRTQAFAKGDYGTSPPFDEFFWAVDDGVAQQALSLGGVTNKNDSRISRDWRMGERKWHWVRLNAGVLSPNRHTLRLWAGSTGFAIDRIVITSESVLNDEIKQDPATPGSAHGMARDMCNPIFGLTVTQASCNTHRFPAEPEQHFIQLPAFSVNNLNDPLFGDYQPYRGSSEAVKAFIARLDPALDQAGLVTFVAKATQRAQLECLVAARIRADQRTTQVNNYPAAVPGVEYDERACYENAVAGTVPISYNNVFIQLEQVRDNDLQGGTNIASGLRRGLHMLAYDTDTNTSTRTHQNDCWWRYTGGTWKIDGNTQPSEGVDSHCGRGQAATPIIVLMTDGSPTKDESLDSACTAWSDSHPLPYEGFEPVKNDAKYECIMYYADLARQYGVIVYVIGLGNGVDHDLLRATAEMTFGQYYYAPSPAALNFIFDQILTNVYISLVQ